MAVEHQLSNDTEVILFVKMQDKFTFNDYVEKNIKKEIKLNLSPKHVPSKIFAIKDIPKTKSNKIVELTIKKIINGETVRNLNVLSNPDCLKEYQDIYKTLN